MAKDIEVPGDELREVQRMLTNVHDGLNLNTRSINFGGTFGRGLSGEAENFERRWNDGEKEIKRQVLELRDLIDQIMDAFEQTDEDSSSRLG